MSNLEKHTHIQFGAYTWRVLEIVENKALILTEEIIGQAPYNTASGPVTWETSSIRAYLNSEFYESFSQEEREKIIQTKVENEDNPWYESKGGKSTHDNVFLLSTHEAVCKYFGDSSNNLINRSPKQRYWFQKKDINNLNRRAVYLKSSWWWWLRSPGRDNKRAVYIHGDGNVGIQGNGTYRYNSNTIHPKTEDNCGGVRPAMWIKL